VRYEELKAGIRVTRHKFFGEHWFREMSSVMFTLGDPRPITLTDDMVRSYDSDNTIKIGRWWWPLSALEIYNPLPTKPKEPEYRFQGTPLDRFACISKIDPISIPEYKSYMQHTLEQAMAVQIPVPEKVDTEKTKKASPKKKTKKTAIRSSARRPWIGHSRPKK